MPPAHDSIANNRLFKTPPHLFNMASRNIVQRLRSFFVQTPNVTPSQDVQNAPPTCLSDPPPPYESLGRFDTLHTSETAATGPNGDLHSAKTKFLSRSQIRDRRLPSARDLSKASLMLHSCNYENGMQFIRCLQDLLSSMTAKEVGWDQDNIAENNARFCNLAFYCLALDYRIHPIPVMNSVDLEIFLRLSRYLVIKSEFTPRKTCDACRALRRGLDICEYSFITAPLLSWGVDYIVGSRILQSICRVIILQDRHPGNMPKHNTVDVYVQKGRFGFLAEKLWIDKSTVINKAVPSTELNARQRLFSALEKVQSSYFVSLESPTRYLENEKAMSECISGWLHGVPREFGLDRPFKFCDVGRRFKEDHR